MITMKVIINIYRFDEVDGETFISVIEEDLEAAFANIKDLEYQTTQDENECEITIFFQNEIEPVEEAVAAFLQKFDLTDNLISKEIFYNNEQGGENDQDI